MSVSRNKLLVIMAQKGVQKEITEISDFINLKETMRNAYEGSFYINHIKTAPSSTKHINYQIDEFISELMHSVKFNELADDLAERAARKIQSVDISSVTTSRHTDTIDVKKRRDDKQTYVRAGKRYGKINTEAFLQSDDSSQELFLNYKHMTKEQNRDSKIDDNNPGRADRLDNVSREQSKHTSKQRSVIDEVKHNTTIKSKSRLLGNVSTENFNHSIKSVEDKASQEFSGEKRILELTIENINYERNHNISTTTPQTTKLNGDDLSATSFESKKVETPMKIIRKFSPEVVEVRRVSTIDSGSSEFDENAESNERSDESSSPIENKQFTRRENGKVYTYVSSPDYAEYHENLAQQKSSRHNFINTYK